MVIHVIDSHLIDLLATFQDGKLYAIPIQNLLEQLDILLTKKWGIFAIGSTKGPKFKCIRACT
jgi:hypothetical protein